MDVQKYQRKTPKFEAIQVTERNLESVAKWCGTNAFASKFDPQLDGSDSLVETNTGECAYVGDWVIRYVDTGHFDVIEDQDFKRNYETAKD